MADLTREEVRRLEVAAMFGELAGYGRLEAEIDRWASERRDERRERFAALKADRPRYEQYLAQKRDYAAMVARAAGRKKHISDETVRTIRKLCEAGVPQSKLARQFGITTASVSLLVRGISRAEAGGPMRSERSLRKAVGADNPKARLTPELAAEIRSSPLSNRQLGRKLGVHHTTVSAVRKGKSWAWMGKEGAQS